MEYIQTTLVQIAASRMEEAAQGGGLLSGLDAHRDFLKSQPGFRDLRITRSINNEGNVLIVVETRWSDDASLVRYETGSDNVAAIVRKHSNVIVANSLQVLDMEALRTESSWAHGEAAESASARVILPIVIPIAALSLILLVVYGLSRVYLDLGGDAAVGLAAGLAFAVLIVAGYLAWQPRVPAWQIVGILGAAAIALAGGVIWAAFEDDDHTEASVDEPGGEEPGGPGPGGAIALSLGDNFFEFDGAKAPAVPIPAAEEVTIDLSNDGIAIHNMRIAGEDGDYNTDDDFASDPDLIRGGQPATITFTLPAGTYDFQCDFHATDMTGTIEAE